MLNLADAQRWFLKYLQCGRTDFVFYYQTVGGRLFGGAEGLQPYFVSATLPHETDYETGSIEIRFNAP